MPQRDGLAMMGIIDNVLRSKLYRFSRTSMTAEEFMVAYPRGVYTGMRTRNRVAVQSFTQHLERFTNSVSALYRDDVNKSRDLREQIALMSKPESVRPLISDLIIGGLKHYENDSCELRLLLLGYYDELRESMCMSVHFTPLAAWNPQQTCMVEVFGDPRASPKVKDSGWVKYRQRYIEQKSPQTDEVLLSRHVGDESRIYEGLSSNFFAVLKNNVVVTAPDDLVLVGTIRALAIKACQALNIAVRYETPSLQSAKSEWSGAFITSTSRMIRPISNIVASGDSIEFTEICLLIRQIQVKVQELLDETAERIVNASILQEE